MTQNLELPVEEIAKLFPNLSPERLERWRVELSAELQENAARLTRESLDALEREDADAEIFGGDGEGEENDVLSKTLDDLIYQLAWSVYPDLNDEQLDAKLVELEAEGRRIAESLGLI